MSSSNIVSITNPMAKSLTKQQIAVLQCKANGLLNKQIAGDFGISEHSIQSHLTSACRRLGANNTIHAVAIAVARGIIFIGEER